jgi:putative peptidoglycan lipid II flippase
MSSHGSLLRALATVSGLTLVSRLLGFVRDFVIAHAFGATAATDAFVVAFRLPNLLRRMFAEGAFSQAFVPLLGEYRNRRGEQETKILVDRTASVLFAAVLLISLLGMAGAPLLIYVSAPGFAIDADKFALTVELTRITFPYILFMSLVALAAGVLNTWGRFAVPAFTPVMLNLAMIAGALLLAPRFAQPIEALAWSVFAGGLLQLAIQAPALMRIGMLPRFDLTWRDEGVQRILKLMAPAVLGVSVAQLSLLINTIFASFLPSGSVSWLYYADRLMEFPAGLLGAALGTILLPSLSRSHAAGNHEQFSALLDWGLRMTLLLTLPAALAMAMLAVPLLSTLFQHGAFTETDVLQTRSALVAYSAGLIGLIMVKILAPGFYARQDVRTPVRIAIISLAATQLMNLAFVGWLQHAGLALSIALASCLNAALLLRGLRRIGTYRPLPGWTSFTAKVLTALAVMGGSLWLTAGQDTTWLAASATERLGHLAVVVIVGAGSYFATLFALGFRLRDFRQAA